MLGDARLASEFADEMLKRNIYVIGFSFPVVNILEKQKQLIADELNVKEVIFNSDEQQFVQLKGKANFRILGKKVT